MYVLHHVHVCVLTDDTSWFVSHMVNAVSLRIGALTCILLIYMNRLSLDLLIWEHPLV